MKLKHRIQEWAADHFKSVQYPDIKPIGAKKPPRQPWTNPNLSFIEKFNILVSSLALMVVALLLLFAFCVIAYAFVPAMLGF